MRSAIGALCLGLLVALTTSAELLTLDQAQKMAQERGWQMRINAVDDTARNWQKKNVVAGYLPQVSYSATVMRMDDSTVNRANMFTDAMANNPMFPKIDDSKLRTRQASLSHEVMVTQPITNGGAEIIAIKMAGHTKKAQRAGYLADRHDLILTVTKQYFELIKIIQNQEILKADLTWAEKNLEASKIRVEGGTTVRTDLLRWQQQVTEKKNALTQMDAVARVSRASLASSLGMDPETAPEWELEKFDEFERRFNALNDLPNGSVDNNARIVALKNYSLLAVDGRKMALAAAMPRLNAFLKYSRDQGWDSPSIDSIFTKAGTWVGGLSLSVPIFSGFRSPTKYREAKYDAIKAQIALDQTKSLMTINLIRIKEFYKASRLTAQSARELMNLTQENLGIMTARYDAGQLTQLDLLEMNKGVIATRIDYISKVLETLSLQSEYFNAIGKTEVLQ